VERGWARVDPPCAIVDRCGGCPVQHVAYPSQLAAKQELTADALERIGGFPRASYELAPIVPSPLQLRYRRRARLHRAAGRSWGFAQRGLDRIEPVDECLLFEPRLQQLANVVRAAGELPGVTDLGLLVGSRRAPSTCAWRATSPQGCAGAPNSSCRIGSCAASRWEGPCWATRW